MLIDLYNKAKKKLSDVETSVKDYVKDDRTTGGILRNTLSPKNVSQAILTAPKYTFADDVSWKNPIKKLGAETLQGTANTFLGVRDFSNEAADQYYGNKPADTKKLAGMGAKSALDLFTLGYGGGAAESLYKQGVKTVATGQIPKLSTQIVKNAAKMGRPSALIGAGYGGADSLEKGDSTKDTVLNTAKGGAMGYGLGSVLGGGSTAVGAMGKAVRNDLAGNVSKKLRFTTESTTPGTVSSQPTVARYGQGANVKVPGFIDTVKSPFQTPQVARQINEALPRPGMNIRAIEGGSRTGRTSPQMSANLEALSNQEGMLLGNQQQSLPQLPKPSQQTPLESPSIQGLSQGNSPYSGNIAQPEQVANDAVRVLKGAETKQRGFIGSVNEGQKTPEELRGQITGDYAVLSDKERISNARKFIQENQQEAETRAYNPQSAEDITIGNQLLDTYIANGQFDKVRTLTQAMAQSGTEMGQAVRSFADYDKTNPAGAIRWAQTKIRQYNTKNPNNPLSLTDENIQSLMEKAKQIQEMPEGRMRNIESNNLMTQINELIPSTIVDKAITLWKAGLLTSLRTTARNILGNTVHQVAEIGKDVPASLADMAMAQRTGQRSMTATLSGLGSGAKKGVVAAWDVMRHGYDPEENIQNFDLHKVTWGKSPIAQAGKFYTEAVFRSLSAQDKVFYNTSYARSMYDQAGAIAINSGRGRDKAFIESLVANPNPDMIKHAIQDASVATFKNKNVLSNIASSIKQKAADIPGMGGEAGKLLTEITLPFTGVPSSIAGQTIAYSPVGLMKGIYNVGKVTIKDVPALQRQAAQEIGRGVLGTGLYGLGAYLVSQGLMTGQPKDANEALQWQLEGKQANSVMVGGKWRSINSVGPEALVTLAGGKIQEGIQSPDGFSVGGTAAGLAKDQMAQTFLSGVQQPLQAITDPARYGKSYTSNMASSVIPNIVKDVAKANDPYARETNSATDSLKMSVPFLRNSLLPKRDVLGNIIPQEPTGAGAFVDLFNSKTPVQNPVVDELSRLYKEGSDATPGKMKNTATVFGEKKKFSPEELDKIEAQTGVNLKPVLENIVQSESYKSLSDEEKQKIIKNTIEDIRQGTKKEVVSGVASEPVSQTDTSKKLSNGEIEIEKTKLANSDQNFKDLGDFVLRKNADGNVTKQSKTAYEAQVSEAKLTSLKKSKDVSGWLKEADSLYKNLQKQLSDSTIDDLEKIQIQNKIDTLEEQFVKYKSYGAFTKGRSGKSKKDTYKSVTDSPSYLIKNLESKFSTKASRPIKLPTFAKGGSQVTKRTRKRSRMITV